MAIYKPSLLDKFKDFVNGLKSNWDIFETHQAESSSKHIHSSGGDASSNYIRFDDGTMICCMRGIKVTGTGGFYIDLSVPLPASFVNSSYTVIVTPTGRYRVSDGTGYTNKYFCAIPVELSPSTIETLRFIYADSSALEPNYEFIVNLVAIGRWK